MAARHERWTVESGVNPKDRVVYELGVFSTVVDIAMEIDGVHVENCWWAEYLCRRLQLMEHAVAESPEAPS